MILIKAKKPNGAEYAVLREFSGMTGVMVTGAYLGEGRKQRETDLVFITPTGIRLVEVKGAKKDFAGEVCVSLNEGWTIGGLPDGFYSTGGRNPYAQSKEVAQVFASAAKTCADYRRAEHLVVVVGQDLTMPASGTALGDGWVALAGDVVKTLGEMPTKSISVEYAHAVLSTVLGLGESLPTVEDLYVEWSKVPVLDSEVIPADQTPPAALDQADEDAWGPGMFYDVPVGVQQRLRLTADAKTTREMAECQVTVLRYPVPGTSGLSSHIHLAYALRKEFSKQIMERAAWVGRGDHVDKDGRTWPIEDDTKDALLRYYRESQKVHWTYAQVPEMSDDGEIPELFTMSVDEYLRLRDILVAALRETVRLRDVLISFDAFGPLDGKPVEGDQENVLRVRRFVSELGYDLHDHVFNNAPNQMALDHLVTHYLVDQKVLDEQAVNLRKRYAKTQAYNPKQSPVLNRVMMTSERLAKSRPTSMNKAHKTSREVTKTTGPFSRMRDLLGI